MAEGVDVPVVGKMNKKILIPILAAGGAFVAWRYYQARNSVGGGDGEDVGYEDPGTIPGVAGAVSPDNSYGSGDTNQPGRDTYGFNGTTNAQWTQYATDQLERSDRWSFTDIAAALGNYLGSKPLTTTQQEIVRAAIGYAGYPPVGSFSIIPGGNTGLTVAPHGLAPVSDATSVTVHFTPVSGAVSYNVYRSGSNVAAGNNSRSPVQITGLTPNTAYSVQVAGVSASGAVGPKSGPVPIRTKGVKLATPSKPTVSAITSTTAHYATKAVAHANGYNWIVNGAVRAHTNGPSWTATNQTPKRTYTVSVQATATTGAPSAQSAKTTYKTK